MIYKNKLVELTIIHCIRSLKKYDMNDQIHIGPYC
jgi:hypothetical protein